MQPNIDDIRKALEGLVRIPEICESAARNVIDQLNAAKEAAAAAKTQPQDVRADDSRVDVDLDRPTRCGSPEVVYGEGKPADLIINIFRQQEQKGQKGFATRLDADQGAAILKAFPNAIHNSLARTVAPLGYSERDTRSGSVAVITAGSCDAPVAHEALETLKWMGIPCDLIEDAGVAGPHRLQKHVDKLQKQAAVVVVAGMEAALPSVVGGYLDCPVIGVPTSVGYGASLGGLTAMLSMLTSCASNVVTVNIDAGFRGGYVAGMIARKS